MTAWVKTKAPTLSAAKRGKSKQSLSSTTPKKGSQVAVEGRLQIDQDRENKTTYTTVVANRVQLLGSKKEAQGQVEPGWNDGMDEDVPFD